MSDYLYRYLIGWTAGAGSNTLLGISSLMIEANRALMGEAPTNLLELVETHLVGLGWESPGKSPASGVMLFALFDDEFVALSYELWWPRTNYTMGNPVFETRIDRFAPVSCDPPKRPDRFSQFA